MNRLLLLCSASLAISVAFAEDPAPAASPVPANPQKAYLDNVSLRADVTEADLKTKSEVAFPVYVINTMKSPLPGVSLDVASGQYDVKVEPSPTWTSFPMLPKCSPVPPCKEFFTVHLKKKPSAAAGPCDVVLKLFSVQPDGRRLVAFEPLADTIDSHDVPLQKAFVFDGTTSAKKWGDSFAIHDLRSYKQTSDGNFERKGRTRTRVQIAADKDSIYFLVTFFRVGADGTVDLFLAPAIDAKPVSIALNRKDGTVRTSLPPGSVEFKKCLDDPKMIMDAKDPFPQPPADTYEGRVSRAALGFPAGNVFYLNVDSPDNYWRGNPASASNPAVFARMVIAEDR